MPPNPRACGCRARLGAGRQWRLDAPVAAKDRRIRIGGRFARS